MRFVQIFRLRRFILTQALMQYMPVEIILNLLGLTITRNNPSAMLADVILCSILFLWIYWYQNHHLVFPVHVDGEETVKSEAMYYQSARLGSLWLLAAAILGIGLHIPVLATLFFAVVVCSPLWSIKYFAIILFYSCKILSYILGIGFLVHWLFFRNKDSLLDDIICGALMGWLWWRDPSDDATDKANIKGKKMAPSLEIATHGHTKEAVDMIKRQNDTSWTPACLMRLGVFVVTLLCGIVS